MKIVSISDTHCSLQKISVPDADLLLHAGDLTFCGSVKEISQELKELGRKAKRFTHGCVLVPGNHDFLAERDPGLMEQMCIDHGITYLQHKAVTINGIKFFGSGYTPFFLNWALNVPRGPQLARLWSQIPDDTQVLITHGPPFGFLDMVGFQHVGCEDLYRRCLELPDLKLHVFGHIHEQRGSISLGNLTLVNASICTDEYKPTNFPIIYNLK